MEETLYSLAPYLQPDMQIIAITFALTAIFAEEAEKLKLGKLYIRLCAMVLGGLLALGFYGLTFSGFISGLISGIYCTTGYAGISKLLGKIGNGK